MSDTKQKPYAVLMHKELTDAVRAFRENGHGMAVFPWPTGSGKTYQTRRMQIDGILRPDEVLVLSYPTRDQCASTFADLKRDIAAAPGIRPAILRGIDAQVETIRDRITFPKPGDKEKSAEQAQLIQALCEWFREIQDEEFKNNKDYRALSQSDDVRKTIRYWLEDTTQAFEANKKTEEENEQSKSPVIFQKTKEGYPAFSRLYRLIWLGVRNRAKRNGASEAETARDIPDRILAYFPDFRFEYSNILICTHAKLFRSLVAYRDFQLVNGDARKRQRSYYVVIDEEEAFCRTYDEDMLKNAKQGAVSLNDLRQNLSEMANEKSGLLHPYLFDTKDIPREDIEKNREIQTELRNAVPGRFPLFHMGIPNEELAGNRRKDAETGLPKYVQLPQHTFRCGRNFYVQVDQERGILRLTRPPKPEQDGGAEQEERQPDAAENAPAGTSAEEPSEGAAEDYLSGFIGDIRHQKNIGARQIRRVRETSWARHNPGSEFTPQADMEHAIRNSVAPGNPSMQRYWENTVFPIRAKRGKPEDLNALKEERDWYQSGLSLHFIDTSNDLPASLHVQRADIHTIQIPATANGYLRLLTERVNGVILLSATAEIRSMDNADQVALKPYIRPADPDELMEIQRLYWEERQAEYRNTELDRILIPEENAGGQEYMRVVTGTAAEQYAERAVRGVRAHGITHGICFGMALSAKWNPTPTNAAVFSSDTIGKNTGLPKDYTVRLWLFSAKGIYDVSGEKAVRIEENTGNRPVWWTHGKADGQNRDTYTFHVADKTILFLLTAYRSADRGFNFEVESEDGTTWSLAGMCCMRQTNTVPVLSDGSVTDKTYAAFEREYWADTTYAAMKQIRMQTGLKEPTPAEGWHMTTRYIEPIVRNRLIMKRDKQSASEKRKAGWSAVSGDYYKDDDMSPFKLTNAAAYEQAIGRIRGNKKKPEYMLLGMMASCISRNEYGPAQVGRIHSYESERVWFHPEAPLSWDRIYEQAKQTQDEIDAKEKSSRNDICGTHIPFQQGNAAKRMEQDLKKRIPAAKRLYASALLSGDEKKRGRAFQRLLSLIRVNEDRKDACCHLMESLEADVRTEDDKSRFRAFFGRKTAGGRPYDPFVWVSEPAANASGELSNTQVRKRIPEETNLSRYTPDRMYIPQLIRILRTVAPDTCGAAFPALSERTADRMEDMDQFPFPPAVCAYTMIAGEVGERVFFGVYREMKAQDRTTLSIVRMSDMPDEEKKKFLYLYEDYDVFVFDSDTPDARRLIGAINVKNAGSHDHEKTVDVLKQKLDRFHQAAGSDVRMRIAYVDVRPGDIHTEYHPGMGGLPVDVCSTGMFRAEDAEKDVTMGQIVRDAEDALHLLERFFGGKEDA